MKQRLIADSGGTKTDWCLIKADGSTRFFTSGSYHPSNWSEEFWTECNSYWSERTEMVSAELRFFGAGCFNKEVAQELHAQFESMGFEDVEVRSDLHAAGIATLNKREGWVAIMGTGSVLFKWKNQGVKELIGGKGHIEGDEGSGFYFGKLVYDAYVNAQLTPEQRQLFEDNVDLKQLEHSIQNGNEKYDLAALSERVGDLPEFEVFHLQNFKAFYEKHLQQSAIKKMQVVGNYGARYSTYLKAVLTEYNVKIDSVVARPITLLIEQMGLRID